MMPLRPHHCGALPPPDDRPRGQTRPGTAQLCVVFDGDDTLWSTELLYDEARAEARQIVKASGLDGARWEALERQIDVENVAVFGHSAERFPQSCRQAYDALRVALGMDLDEATANTIEQAARKVFDRPAQLTPGASDTLRTLKEHGARLGLLTKGDPVVQRKRISDSTLAPYFDAISIVPTKSPEIGRAHV